MIKNNQVVLITGASKGIGRNTAIYLAEKGFTVIATGRNIERLKSLEADLKQKSLAIETIVMDVKQPEQIATTVQSVLNNYSKIDILVNNAGIFTAIGPTWEVNLEDWINDVQTNLFSVFNTIQAVIPIMLKQKYGRVINIVGGGTFNAFRYGNSYGTSKTAIARFTENLSKELENSPIKVFALDPGLNDTDMTRNQRETEIGKQYLSRIEQLFKEKVDVSPYQAPKYIYELVSGNYDEFAGRIVSVHDQLNEIKQKINEDDDFLKLRLNI
ncbi:SDR family NAD(P)-dependent oxidoreductase [Aquibacillus halophilus]|uniref:SDR family NAD(P)-dependent oxidoreductase n=1 Tax=Aquibacillus halophilus TaxID=930132 RepID=A0A6A8D774_9BACI|nr:SDR family oxidoreductase [Aquibacillus halophilus]MRH41603.1 SDR family NAD(P)-dependent oxidoreductase [Aquibacillus halophilus]